MKCHLCDGYSTDNRSNLIRHLKDVHKCSAEDVFELREEIKKKKAERATGGDLLKCAECGQTFAVKKSLSSHISRKHRKKPENPAEISLFPDQSDSGSAPKKIRKQAELVSLKCPETDCEETFETRENLAQHYSDSHKPDSEVEKQIFETETEFEAWLNNRNQETCTDWKIRSSHDGTTYRMCSHEGVHQSQATKNVVRNSKKLTGNSLCPAYLKTKKNFSTGQIEVTSFFHHFGHMKKHEHRKLNNQEIDILVRLMRNGLTNPQIVRYCDKEYGNDSSSRLAHLLVDDLRNIRKNHNLYSGRFDDDDLISVAKRVERNDPEDGIIHYNPPDESGAGMRLVIMTPAQKELCSKYSHRGISVDDTHNSTRYSLKLTTIIVLNGLDRGIPIGFMLSSSCTSEDVEIMFQCIKREVPSFNPEFVMSDEAPVFWNGFKSVWPDTKAKRLWCRWHTLRALGKNADEILGLEDSKRVKATLGELIREPEPVEFHKGINSLLDTLEKMGSKGQRYANYFRKNYLGKAEIWAACYRPFSPFQTSMINESWHAGLKKNIVNMHTNIRVDELIEALYEAFLWVIRKLAKQTGRNLQKASSRRAENLKNCRKASDVQSKYSLSRDEEGCFSVEKKGTDVIYRVVDRLGCSCFESENCHCTCGACSYRYSCSCRYSLSGVSCKHVHLVLQYLNSYEEPNDVGDEYEQFTSFPKPAEIPTFEYPDVSRSADNELASKIYDQFNREVDTISAKMRSMKKDAGSLDLMKNVLEQIQKINSEISKNEKPNLPIRRNADAPSHTARETMNFSKFPKREKNRKKCGKAEAFPIRRNVAICSSCGLADPELPEDMDDEEQDARVTEWYRCSNPRCHLAVHFLCASGHCVACQSSFEPHPDEDSEPSFNLDSSDDDMSGPSTSTKP
ncbi:hypothetical protein B9Z55_005034 [Caenorhabditis nigoni]|nr:hypothetical protein B9Z55_005034 [Caenorhabditis nigoni]